MQSVRETADKGIATAVATVNALLGQFATANAAVVKATVSGTDATDAIDSRNAVLQSLSAQLGITTADAGNGGLAIYTDGGATLFQGTARAVTFTPTGAFASGTVGGAVTVDGVAVTGAGAAMASKGGAIAGLAQLRDTAAVAYGDQLDQIADGLVTAFSGTTSRGPPWRACSRTGPRPPCRRGLARGPGGEAERRGGRRSERRDQPGRHHAQDLRHGDGAARRRLQRGRHGQRRPGRELFGPAHRAEGQLAATQPFSSASGGASSGTLAAYAASSVSWLEAPGSRPRPTRPTRPPW